MLKLGGDPDLAEEAVTAERGGELGKQDLDGDLAAVADVVGQIDDRHAAPPQLSNYRVLFGQREAESLERIANQSITQRSAPMV